MAKSIRSDEAIRTDVVIAKALRSSFCEKKSDLLSGSWMSDETVVKLVREMQEEYKHFKRLCDDIKQDDEKAYNVEILGLDS